MSNANEPLDDDPWGTPVTGDAGAPVAAPVDDAHVQQASDDVVDVEHEEVAPRKKSKVVPIVIGVVALGALAGTGGAFWSMYTKLTGGSERAASTRDSGPAIIETTARPAVDGLPAPGGTTAAVFPAASASSATPMAAGDVAPAPTPAPVVVAPAPAVVPPVPAPAVAAAPAPAVVAAPAPTPAPSPAASAPPASPAPAVAAVPAPAPAVAATAKPAKVAKQQAAPRARPRPAAADMEVAEGEEVISRSSGKGSSKQAQASRNSKAAASGAGVAPSASAKAERSSADEASLTSYSIVSIYPRSGDYQQAWVRDPAGRIHVVRAGDLLAGIKVVAVDFREHVVKTAAGQIR